jgi:hypothetical protein
MHPWLALILVFGVGSVTGMCLGYLVREREAQRGE